ncbi:MULTISPECIES: ParB/RepB/Spo0J family partition protein [unclassified Streptomyces]|uniref:ParB/RepB/Spo0J family partition protein n=1 Tax=unclassified Streptomyces TaxID=2593676 RepID=UPI00093EFD41|nr:plasmid partitioning protein [Streptomyces sp. CB01883]OKJ74396.1 plasmid partitioning protein [Streptomyces sp. CB01883]
MSSIADKLGTGSSFGQARRERSARGRAKAVTEGEIPAYELVRLRLDEVASTPLNPRRNFGTDAELTRFGEELRQAQLAACVAVTRVSYLALWPDHEEHIGAASHVLVNGERRFRSAVHVGLDSLDFVVRDDLASSREQFIKHLLEENLSREDFDVVERARGVEQLVTVCEETSGRGARSRAAEQLGKDRSWVTNQLALLTLPVEIQTMLSAGTMSERDGRTLARHLKDNPGLEAADLVRHLQETKDAAARTRALEKEAVVAARESLLSADNKPEPEAETQTQDITLSADNKPRVPAQAQPDAEQPAPPSAEAAQGTGGPHGGLLSADNKPQTAAAAGVPGEAARQAPPPLGGDLDGVEADSDSLGSSTRAPIRPLPYDDPGHVAMLLKLKMQPPVFATCTRMMIKALREQQPDAYSALMRELAAETG